MTVLAQTFNIMTPDIHTLRAELSGDKQALATTYSQRTEPIGKCNIIPSPSALSDYLVCPIEDDPKLTQIDILKSNSIEIFYNLLLVQTNNFNTKAFLCSES